jgi:PAS domain S-box-containing protein
MSSTNAIQQEIDRLRERLAEYEEALAAVRSGQVDALVQGTSVYILDSAENDSSRFRAQVLSQMNDAVVALDTDGHITYLNPAAEQLYGCKASDMLGFPLTHCYDWRWVRPEDEAEATRTLEETDNWRGETIHVKKSGEVIRVEASISNLRDAEGRHVGRLGVMRDITERIKSVELMEEHARQKDLFLATLAHELRNPLSPLMNGLYLLGESGDPADRTIVGMMERQMNLMVRLVDDLLDVSRISHGKLELRNRHTEVGSIVRIALETTKPLIEARGHTLTVELAKEPVFLMGDPDRLAQLISNLLNNAAKYTPLQGTINLNVRRDGDHIEISVKDSGIGLSADDAKRVFDLFVQVRRDKDGDGGLGIGLNLAQRLAQMHKGSLTVHSDGIGKGCTFTLRLPALSAEKPITGNGAQVTQHQPGNTARRIMVVDDNEDGAFALGAILRRLGHTVEVVYESPKALELLPVVKPEIVFMDIGMPIMNGYEVCMRMRAEQNGMRSRIVALSGWGQEQDRDRSLAAGFDAHLVKPVDMEQLQRIIREPLPDPLLFPAQ